MKLVWHPDAWDEHVSWQTSDRKTLNRINTLIRDIQRGDDGGIGKPELLKGDLSGWASRRINGAHRSPPTLTYALAAGRRGATDGLPVSGILGGACPPGADTRKGSRA